MIVFEKEIVVDNFKRWAGFPVELCKAKLLRCGLDSDKRIFLRDPPNEPTYLIQDSPLALYLKDALFEKKFIKELFKK